MADNRTKIEELRIPWMKMRCTANSVKVKRNGGRTREKRDCQQFPHYYFKLFFIFAHFLCFTSASASPSILHGHERKKNTPKEGKWGATAASNKKYALVSYYFCLARWINVILAE